MFVDDEVYYTENCLYYPCDGCLEEDKGNCVCAELLEFLRNLG